MTYDETTEYLFSQTANYEKQGQAGYKPGLGNMLALDEHLGHPHRRYRTLHVAGTNGKGSVSHTLAAWLQLNGLHVGLYTSPHIVDFSERIRVDGQPIEHDYIVDFVRKHRHVFEPLGASFFEITTAMAFQYFADKGVDIAVVEVGLGGRLDSTNIITPQLSIITNISLDHTQLLGNTVEQIAAEKAGIIKPGVTCVVGEADGTVRQVFTRTAHEQGAPLIIASDSPLLTQATPLSDGSGIHYTTTWGLQFDGALTGSYQQKNTNTVLCAIQQLQRMGIVGTGSHEEQDALTAQAFNDVCRLTGLTGRWQQVGEQPRVVCDMGHNPGAWTYLSQQLKAAKCSGLRIVYGALEDKDISTVMKMLPAHARYYWTKASTHRACPETKLQTMGDELGLKGQAYPTVRQAYEAASSDAKSTDMIFVGGSAYVVAEFLKSI